MHGSFDLISTMAVSLAFALVLGFVATKLRLPTLVGYLMAGVLVGPATPGFVGDMQLASELAEIGVILLMFGVGLHFSLNDLLSVRHIAVPGALVQISVATALGILIAHFWGWSFGAGLVMGLCLSVASTVVLLRALEDRGLLDSINGRIAVGWLIVEDLVMVLVLVLLPALTPVLLVGGDGDIRSLWAPLLLTLGRVALFIALMLVVGRRLFPWLLSIVARTGSRELFTLCVIAVAVGIAYGSAILFHVSFALGAFFAGMVMRESSLSHRAASESLPLRDAFAVLFFVSVGMLFDPQVLVQRPLEVLIVVAIIMVGKSLAAFLLVLSFRYPLNTALTVSASLAQVGEFSFILAALGVSQGLLPVEGQSLIVAGAMISISLNSLLFRTLEPAQRWIRSRSKLARSLERPEDPLRELPMDIAESKLTGHIVLVGYGGVGKRVADSLHSHGLSLVVVDENREIVEQLRSAGRLAVAGDAARAEVLVQAHVARARILVITCADVIGARTMIEITRALNPLALTIVRTHTEEESELMREEMVDHVLMDENELALNMSSRIAMHLSKQTA